MNTARQKPQANDRAYALLLTIVFTVVALLMAAGMMTWIYGASLQTERNNLFRASTDAADAATSLAMAYMWRDFYGQTFGSASAYTGYLPNQDGWPVQFSFSNGSRVANHIGVSTVPSNWTTNWQSLGAFSTNYTGLSAFIAQCTVTATATTANQPYDVSATVQQKFALAAIPVFQFAVFYNLNLEFDPGQPLSLSGPVFSNEGIWARGQATYDSSISAVGTVTTNSTDPFASNKTDSNGSTFDAGITTNVNSLTLPLATTTNSPAAVQALLGLPPSGTPPYSATGQSYFINEANIIISNSPTGRLSAFYQDPNASTPITGIPYNVGSNAYSFVTNVTFYDYREKKTVQAVQLNVGAFDNWLTNSGSTNGATFNNEMYLDNGHYIDSVYVYDNYNNNAMSLTNLNAVRVANGAILPTNGLTVITPQPLYVLGNYNASGVSLNNGTNVSNTKPAALIGDAITVLSTNWNDSWNSGTALTARIPTNTTVNAAALEGIVQSKGTNYSGGVENFLRLLEDWNTSTPLTYNGSIVVMFPSQYATNIWGGYYGVPKRVWGFDVNFLTQNGLPPLSPSVQAIIRQNWAVY